MDTQTSPLQIGWKLCQQLVLFSAVVWLVLAGPAYWVAGVRGMEGLSIAAVLCLVPGCLAFLAVNLLGKTVNPLGLMVTTTMLRMMFVLGGVMVMLLVGPRYGMKEFFTWLILFYLATLMFETLLILRKLPSGSVDESSVHG